jgi:hypothetical protein
LLETFIKLSFELSILTCSVAADNDDDLARLEARFDPEYASFKNQLDALFKHNKISTN